MDKTKLSRWVEIVNEGDSHATPTRETWEIPEAGAEFWCNRWVPTVTITPLGDGEHVSFGSLTFLTKELMDILSEDEKIGLVWGISGITPVREQLINGCFTPVPIKDYKMIDRVQKYFKKILDLNPQITEARLSKDGKIYYINEGIGTQVCWEELFHVCEFFMYFNDMEERIRVIVFDDHLVGYVSYDPEDGGTPPICPEPESVQYESAKYFAEILLQEADMKGKFNVAIDRINFTAPLKEERLK